MGAYEEMNVDQRMDSDSDSKHPYLRRFTCSAKLMHELVRSNSFRIGCCLTLTISAIAVNNEAYRLKKQQQAVAVNVKYFWANGGLEYWNQGQRRPTA